MNFFEFLGIFPPIKESPRVPRKPTRAERRKERENRINRIPKRKLRNMIAGFRHGARAPRLPK